MKKYKITLGWDESEDRRVYLVKVRKFFIFWRLTGIHETLQQAGVHINNLIALDELEKII